MYFRPQYTNRTVVLFANLKLYVISKTSHYVCQNILTIPNLYILTILLIMQSNVNSFLKETFDHRLRNNFNTQKNCLQLTEKTPSIMDQKLYNKLLLNIKI